MTQGLLRSFKRYTYSVSQKNLKYVATLPCNVSLMACFADINVLQGSMATYARRDGIFNLPVKFFNQLRFHRIMVMWPRHCGHVVMLLWPHFFGPPCTHIESGPKKWATDSRP